MKSGCLVYVYLRMLFSVSPKVQVVPKKLFAKLKSDQELACVIYGNPRPSVQWYRNGMAVVPDDYVQVVDGHNLRLLGLISSDEAMYQCMATSKAGTAQASVRLKVVEQGQGKMRCHFLLCLW